MLVKRIDYLSPRITLYYKEVRSHSSILSGILSIVFIIIKIFLGVYYSLDLIERKDPKAFYYNTFIEDAPEFPLNSSSLFHFLSLDKKGKDPINEGIDFTKFRIIGFQISFENVINNPANLQLVNHWIYGNCNSEDIEGINYLINYDFFEKSACIKKYFDANEKKYYNKGESKFRWPIIAHGGNNPNNKFYSLYMGKCQEDTLNLILGEGHHCKTDLEIDEYFKSREVKVLNFYFVDNYVNILHYTKPLTKYIYKIETQIFNNQYSTNNINFNPATIETNNGLFTEKIKKEISYIFQRNDVYISETNGRDIYCAYSIWLKNTNMFYNRSYKKIQEIFSSIGGINSIINFIGIIINRLYNKYIVLCNTEQFLLSIINSEKINNKNNIIKIKNINEISINNTKKNKEIIQFNRKDKADNINENNNSEINLSKPNNFFILNAYSIQDKIRQLIKNDENKNINGIANSRTMKKRQNFFNYLLFQLTLGHTTNSFQIYDKFRRKIISEECFIKNHLNLYNLLTTKEKKTI